MTTNPYAPPGTQTEIAPARPEKSIARRISLVLAAAGFVGFWGTLGLCGIFADADRVGTSTAMAIGAAMLLAIATNVVGVTIAFAAVPAGRRLLPALLNTVSLAILVAVLIVSLATE
jgi:hypothetical protein